jgi:hypothetical protein
LRTESGPGHEAPHKAEWGRARRLLLALLVLGFSLRVVLVLRGGQRFFPDEGRYTRSITFAELLSHAEGGRALDLVLAAPDHTGFVIVGALPALAQGLYDRYSGHSRGETLWLPALLLSAASVSSIGLVFALARRLSATPSEALGASFILSCATTFFYFSRHLLPYDASMALCLGAAWIGLRPRVALRDSFACGLLGSAALLTYNGYWTIVVVVLSLHALHGARSPLEALRRGLLSGAGLLSLPALLALASAARGGAYLESLARFSRTVTQCDMAEGWSVVWEYLWHAEHGLLLAWAGGAVSVLAFGRRLDEGARRRAGLWLLSALSVYGLLVISSSALGRFCVYGRLARQIVPFLCLALASAATGLGQRERRLACGLLVIQAALNLRQPFLQQFPGDFAREAGIDRPSLRRDTSVLGPANIGLPFPARYVLLNTRYLHPVLGPKAPPEGEVIIRAPHPLEFLPYQYESFTALERRILRETDISMRLIDTRPRRGEPQTPIG